MLTIPDAVKALFQRDGVNKNFHVHFPNGETTDLNNDDILQESVQFVESLCSQQFFKFGLAEASQIEFTAVGIPNVLGATIECAIEIDCTSLGAQWATDHPIDPTLDFLEPQTCDVNGSMYYRVPYGRFIVNDCPRNHGAMWQRRITAYSPNTLFNNTYFPHGEYPLSSLTIDAMAWITAQTIKRADMNHVVLALNTKGTQAIPGLNIVQDVMSGSTSLTYMRGIGRYGYGDSRDWIKLYDARVTPVVGATDAEYVFITDYAAHVFDNYSKALYETVIPVVPSGYVKDGYGNTVYKNNKYGFFAAVECFSPCLYLYEEYENSGGTLFSRCSKPIFIESGVPIYVKLDQTFAYWTKVPKNYTIKSIELVVSVPCRWERSETVQNPSSIGAIGGKRVYLYTSDLTQYVPSSTDWNNAAPFDGQSVILRDGDLDFYWAEVNTGFDFPDITIQNTLKYSKCSGSGSYYTYANAISNLDIVKGMMELTGSFWKTGRDGDEGTFVISENQTAIPISASQWEEFWWDENDVDSIGTVTVKFPNSEDGDENIESFSIGSGESVYTMEDNKVLENTPATSDDIRTVLNTYFAPNASVINFTPVDLNMKGLPYLETGDKITLTAEDGTTVQTYILELTVSGIQNIRAEISSVNGDLIGVTQ